MTIANQAQAKRQLSKKVQLNKLPKDEARVLIALDVLAQLRLKKIQPVAQNGYFFFDVEKPVSKPHPFKIGQKLELRDLFTKLPKGLASQCTVCALGALFMADVARRDDYKIRVEGVDVHYPDITLEKSLDREEITLRLEDFFAPEQLNLIEGAFECSVSGLHINAEEELAAQRFGLRFSTSKKRLAAIMENIIKNKGEFVP